MDVAVHVCLQPNRSQAGPWVCTTCWSQDVHSGRFLWMHSVCMCLLFSYYFFAAAFFLTVMQYSLLSAHRPPVLLVLLVHGNRFLCLICSLVWRSSCSLFQCTIWMQRFSSPCPSFTVVFKKEGSERGNQTHFNCLLEKSLHSQAMSLKAKGLLRLWNSWTFAQHGWARA